MVKASNVNEPIATFCVPVVNACKASLPKASLETAVVAELNALCPTPVLLVPSVKASPDLSPTNTF